MKKVIALTTILAGFVASTQAGLILSDQFNYVDGGIVTNVGSTWMNNSGTTPMLVSNDTLIVSTARSEDIFSFLSGQPYMTNSGAVLYSRYTLKCVGLPNAAGTYFSHFGGSNVFNTSPLTGHRARVWASSTNTMAGTDGGTAGLFYLYIINSQGSVTNGGGVNMWPTALATNTSYTIVTRYNVGSGVSALWVNPSAETDPSTTDPIVIPLENPPPTNGPINISAYDFRQAANEGTMLINDLRVGTRFADVAGANTAPLISSMPNQAIPANASTGPIPFTVEDGETPAHELVVSNSSSNPTLVPANAISFVSDSGGTNRTITVTPAAGQQGSATITVYVSDSVNVSFTTFQVTVGAPTISSIPNQIAFTNTPVPPASFTVADAENDTLTFGVASSNPALVPSDNSHIIISGTGSSRTATLLPTAGVLGTTTITVSASDGHNNTQTTFALTMRPHIGIVYNENFNYTSWDAGTDQSLITGHGGSGGPWSHVSGNVQGEIQVTNGLVYLVHTNSEDVGANFLGPTVYDGFDGVVFYCSFPVNFSFPPSPNGDYFFHYQTNATDGSTFHCKLYASTKHAAEGKFRLGIANTASAGPVDEFPADLSTNVNYTVVTRYNSGIGESALWVNPYTEAGTHALAKDAAGASFTGAVGLRQPSSAIGDLTVGPMKVSTEWSDVVGTVSPLKIQQTDATHVQLIWSYPFTLQTSSSLEPASWTDVIGAASPYTYTIMGDQQYFRLSY
jgi:hypothetical protein